MGTTTSLLLSLIYSAIHHAIHGSFLVGVGGCCPSPVWRFLRQRILRRFLRQWTVQQRFPLQSFRIRIQLQHCSSSWRDSRCRLPLRFLRSLRGHCRLHFQPVPLSRRVGSGHLRLLSSRTLTVTRLAATLTSTPKARKSASATLPMPTDSESCPMLFLRPPSLMPSFPLPSKTLPKSSRLARLTSPPSLPLRPESFPLSPLTPSKILPKLHRLKENTPPLSPRHSLKPNNLSIMN